MYKPWISLKNRCLLRSKVSRPTISWSNRSSCSSSMDPYLDKGHHLFTDNWYNSVALAKYMTLHKTYITGTLRAVRMHIPTDVMKEKWKKGEMVSQSLNDVSVIK